MSITEFKLPDLGEGLQEVEIISWHVAEGDFVVNEQPLLSVETEKAVVDIPSPQSGKILKIHGNAGDTMEIGCVLVEFSNDNGASSEDSGSVVGNLGAADEPVPIAPIAPATPITQSPGANIKAIPAARKLAQDLGVDLTTVKGTGPNGTITIPDVKGASSGGASSTISPSSPGYEPITGVRKAMANMMAKSHKEVVPATIQDEVDVQAWMGRDNIMVRMIQALVEACKAEPIVNSWFENNAIKRNEHINLGIAVDTPNGLLVPVMKGAENLSADQIKAELGRIKESAQSRTLAPAEFKDGTITLSNFGAIAGQHGAMVIAPPQVAILGCGRLTEKVVMENGVAVAHKFIPLSLTIDHRALTGGEAARFMGKVIESLSRG